MDGSVVHEFSKGAGKIRKISCSEKDKGARFELLMQRCQIRTDKNSGITSDPNNSGDEHGKPRYILDLLLSIFTVSLEIRNNVRALPALQF